MLELGPEPAPLVAIILNPVMATGGRDVVHSAASGEWQMVVVRGGSPSHANAEAELSARGVVLPFGSRVATQQLSDYAPGLFFAIQDAQGSTVGGFGATLRRAPVPGGHQLLRAEHFGAAVPLDAAAQILDLFNNWLAQQSKILRASIDLFSFDVAHRRHLAELLAQRGFQRAPRVNGYVETLLLDLAPSEETLFANLHHSARRKIRQLDKHPIELRTISDPLYASRMNRLLLETFARTGGQIEERDWGERIRLSNEHPDVSRIVGLFHKDVDDPDGLLAYAWGCYNGDSVFYSEAASTRDTGEQRIAVAYGVMWDLIKWAKRTGAKRFDFGGVTRGSHGGDDSLGGISDFKRYFSEDIVEVREEWIRNDHTLRARVVGAVHRRLRGG
jgi:hypothetical protein